MSPKLDFTTLHKSYTRKEKIVVTRLLTGHISLDPQIVIKSIC